MDKYLPTYFPINHPSMPKRRHFLVKISGDETEYREERVHNFPESISANLLGLPIPFSLQLTDDTRLAASLLAVFTGQIGRILHGHLCSS